MAASKQHRKIQDAQAECEENASSQGLNRELGIRAYTMQIVINPEQKNKGCWQQYADQNLRRETETQAGIAPTNQTRYSDSKNKSGKDCNATNPWQWNAVQMA